MKLIFITGLYPKESIEDFRGYSKGKIQNAPDAFQWAVVDGLYKNDIDFHVISCPFLPAYPLNNRRLVLPEVDIRYNGRVIGTSLPYCTAAMIKSISIRRLIVKYIIAAVEQLKNHNSKEKIVLLTYSVYTPFLQVLKRIKMLYPDILTASIVTDLPDDMMEHGPNQNLLKRIQCSVESKRIKRHYRYIDKFVLLSYPMTEKIPESIGCNCVIEGVAVPKSLNRDKIYEKTKTLLYTGTIDGFSGVKELITAFQSIEEADYRLLICGSGVLEPFIKEASRNDNRIIYKGMVSREEALQLQSQSTALINPRKPDDSLTRFSFPSKTMEYLMSGTVMMGYRLEGIPEEYYEYYFTIDDMSEEALSKRIKEVLSLPEDELRTKAYKAYKFIMENKASEKQVRKMMDFLAE